jgi:hypothetical protein
VASHLIAWLASAVTGFPEKQNPTTSSVAALVILIEAAVLVPVAWVNALSEAALATPS